MDPTLNQPTRNRLFVPLSKEAFRWFKAGKKWEIRRLNKGQYNLKNIRLHRQVELRLGYNGESLWGTIDQILTFTNSYQLVNQIDYTELIPTATSVEDAIDKINSYVSSNEQLIVFKVKT